MELEVNGWDCHCDLMGLVKVSAFGWVSFWERVRERGYLARGHRWLRQSDEEIGSFWGLMRDFFKIKKVILSETF